MACLAALTFFFFLLRLGSRNNRGTWPCWAAWVRIGGELSMGSAPASWAAPSTCVKQRGARPQKIWRRRCVHPGALIVGGLMMSF